MNPSNKIDCFVSYSDDDTDTDNVEATLHYINIRNKNVFNYFFYKSQPSGIKNEEFMDNIFNSKIVFVFLSPSYKKKITDVHKNSGAYKEYKKILTQIENKRKDSENTFYLQLFLMSGNEDTSIPAYFRDYKYVDFTKVSFSENNGKKIKSKILTKSIDFSIKKQIEQIGHKLKSDSVLLSEEYNKHYKEVEKDLFIETKAEYIDLPDDVFVKTLSYLSIKNQESFFLIGRKGSGKSTVYQTIEKIDSIDHKAVIHILADNFQLEETFSILSDKKYKRDIYEIITIERFFGILWQSFFSIFHLYAIFFNQKKVEKKQKTHLRSINSFFNEKLLKVMHNKDVTNENEVSECIYTFCFNNLIDFFNVCVNNARSEDAYFLTDIKTLFSFNSFFSNLIGEETAKDYEGIISKCNGKVLFTLDGFDNKFEKFRSDTIKYCDNNELVIERKKMEMDWFSSFLDKIYEFKRKTRNLKNVEIIDLCITVPLDRYIDVRSSTRDFVKIENRTIRLNWSGNELESMIKKRVLHLIKMKRIKDTLPLNFNHQKEEHLEISSLMKYAFPNVPQTMSIDINNHSYEIDLFQYILRYSFWRPRDVLRYYSKIISLSKIKKDECLNQFDIKRIVCFSSKDIIKDEFLSEFSNLFDNLKNVIDLFYKSNLILDYKDVLRTVNNKSLYKSTSMSPVKVVQHLYEIGFFGLLLCDEFMKLHSINTNFAFIFNEGSFPFENSCKEFEITGNSRNMLIINPIFVEHLSLIINSDKIICNFSWDYLRNNGAVLHLTSK